MSVCIECGKPACGEEIVEGQNGKLTCYFCHWHIDQSKMDKDLSNRVQAYVQKNR